MTPQAAEANPRSAKTPMAFTSWEMVRGLLVAGLSFTIAVPTLAVLASFAYAPGQLWFTLYVLFVGMLAVVPSTVLALISLTPAVRAIGRRLSSETRHWPHVLSYTALAVGASIVASLFVGLAIGLTTGTGDPVAPLAFTVPVGIVLAPLAAGAAAFGWYSTMRHALADDRNAALQRTLR